MIASGEEVASQMALRALDHTLQYGELNVRRAIPLALSFLSISNPQLTVMDTLSKLTHDQDQQVSQNSILALGFLGAGSLIDFPLDLFFFFFSLSPSPFISVLF